ncbi:MAG TPA: 4Fe-4S binding protein [Syntrophorhabdaceae bacterium]|nr:4Fe-4S binding protein [Syntrophorhabdaceae bacterium]HOD76267.1 4Fe-4S binding protein [Syntrophorhabdaceae bacterium]
MRPYISRASCIDCRECVSICPYEVFTEKDGTVVVETPEDCVECGACVENCRQEAIYFDD